MISSLAYNKLLSFDYKNGILKCQSGLLLKDILDVIVPKGWFLPVTPGTKLITMGGAIASNVHGKNHHKEGAFSDHLVNFSIMLDNGSIVICSKDKNQDLFWATCGGMGLTGFILDATITLKPIETAYIKQLSLKANNLDELIDYLHQYRKWTYTVAWMNTNTKGKSLGKGIVICGEHATLNDVQENKNLKPLAEKKQFKLNIPFFFPSIVLNFYSIQLFNFLYFHKQIKKRATTIIPYDNFFYPLDKIQNWNRIYGRRGFVQYQFVIPEKKDLIKVIEMISRSRKASFLTVLKEFGHHQQGLMSFPMKGYTLALDFPISKGIWTFLNELDQCVLKYKGRVYLAKDARMTKDMFFSCYPNAQEFVSLLKSKNIQKFTSLQSQRLGLTIKG